MPESLTPKPATFRDTQGCEWNVRLDFAGLHRIRDGANVDLGNVEQIATTWAELLYDDAKALEVIWKAIQPAAQEKGVTQDDYSARMDGDSLQAALEALGNAITSFTQPRKRGMVEGAIREVQKGMEAAVAQAEQRISEAVKGAASEAVAALWTSPPSVQESSATSTTAGR